MTDGRRARGIETRARVIAAARRLFGERGYEHTSIEDVLGAAGVARGALYHHFASKAALFDAVAEEVFAEIAQRTDAAALQSGRDPLQRIRSGASTWLELSMDPAVQRISLLDPQSVLGWERWRGLDERHTLGGLRAAFGRLEAQRRVPAGQGELLAHLWLAALNEAALFIASAEDQQVALQTASATIDALLDRIVAAPDDQLARTEAPLAGA